MKRVRPSFFHRCHVALTRLAIPQQGQLSNGLHVFALNDDSGMCAVGLFTQAGCRFETPTKWQGASWLLERMVLKSNKKYTRKEMLQKVYDLGGIFNFKSEFRESMYLISQCMKASLRDGLELSFSPFLHVDFTAEDLEEGKAQAIKELEFISKEPSRILFEHIHRTAYNLQSVGQPLWPSEQIIQNFKKEDLESFVKHFWRPDRIAVVVSGASLEEVIPILEDLFSKVQLPQNLPEIVNPPAVYTGGQCMIFNTAPPPTVHEMFVERNLTHVGLVFKGLPESDPNIFALGVLQHLLGGGTAFSQGGPGKGMYTKLYRSAVNVYGDWLWGIEAVMSAFGDTGLFGLYSQAPHTHVKHQLGLTIHQMATCVQDITEDMLNMAKNQYLSLIFMACEERMAIVEGVGKSWTVYKKVWSPTEIKESVLRLRKEDIIRAGHALLQSEPTYVVYGNTPEAIPYENIQSVFLQVRRQINLFGKTEIPAMSAYIH